MFEFLNKAVQRSQQAQPAQPANIEPLIAQLNNAIRAQFINGNISAAELQKFIELVNNRTRLRTALQFL